ncbi:MAG: VOC family protein [Desulfobacteraceae bacterium]|nr:VOC family protein [Desulfobacteraceae bacterium]
MTVQRFKTANTILYCRQWEQAVAFYRDRLSLPVNFSNDWFVEFRLTDGSRISIADETRASVKSCGGKGITLALEVEDIDSVRADMEKSGIGPTDIRDHPWGARVFYFYDPEGHRIEIWQAQRPSS